MSRNGRIYGQVQPAVAENVEPNLDRRGTDVILLFVTKSKTEPGWRHRSAIHEHAQ
jgi:hypothetical protein